MSGFDIAKYREMFLVEAEEMFATIEDLLLTAERNRHLESDELQALFRAAHTLKGGAGAVEYVKFTKFVHQLENFLDRLRNSEIKYIHEMADFLITSSDRLKDILRLETDGELHENDYEAWMSELLSCIGTFSGKTAVVAHDDEEGFGFFDDEAPAKAAPKAPTYGVFANGGDNYGLINSSTESASEEGFGFFDNAPKASVAEEGFGFFDNAPKASVAEEGFGFFDNAPKASVAEEGFGFFDKTPSAVVVDKKPLETKVVVEQKDANAPVKQLTAGSTIRVDLGKIDLLMNNIGEQVIGISMLYQFIDSITENKLRNGLMEKLDLLERHIRELQESVMSMRMVPMEEIYAKFPKMIRDTAKKIGKQIDFVHFGDNVEIDKAMVEGLTDPLMHIIRNAIDHGIEQPADRKAAGKKEMGTVTIGAEQANGQIIITIMDDGKGIDAARVGQKALERGLVSKEQLQMMSSDDICEFIFHAGLSTADQVTDISGRGVGMDVVKSNITKLGGAVSIKTERGIGTKFIIALPLTLAILDGLNISVGQSRFILPLSSIVESLQPQSNMIKAVGDGSEELLMLREEFIPVVRLHKIFNVKPMHQRLEDGMLIVVKAGGQKLALFVDEFLHQQQVVIKPLDKNFRNIQGIGGATVRGDGSIGLILDVLGILDLHKTQKLHRSAA